MSVPVEVSFARQIGLHAGYLPGQIINSGLNGNKSADMLARLQSDVLSHQPDVCVFMPLTNDANNNVGLGVFSANVTSIIGQMVSAGIKVVVISPPIYRGGAANYGKFDSYLKELERIVDVYSLDYIDLFRLYAWEFMLDSTYFVTLYTDVVHQSVTGYNFISDHCNSDRYTGFFVKDKKADLVNAIAAWAVGGQVPEDLAAVQQIMEP